PCACGRHGFRFQVTGRTDDMVTVKGVNFHIGAIQGYLRTLPRLSGEYKIHVSRAPIHELRLDLEIAQGQVGTDWPELAHEIALHISQQYSVKVNIRFLEFGEIPKTDDKTKRLIRE